MEDNNNKNINLEVVIGDTSSLEISDVGDCVNSLRPKDNTKNKKKVIIPKTQEEKNKSRNNKN